jgi:NTE family protein
MTQRVRSTPARHRAIRVLCVAPTEAAGRALADAGGELYEEPGLVGSTVAVRAAGCDLHWRTVTTADEAMRVLGGWYVNMLVIDLRRRAADAPRDFLDEGRRLLDALDSPFDMEARYGFHRVMALVADPEGDEVDELIAELGRRGVGSIRQQRVADWAAFDPDADESFGHRVLAEVGALVRSRHTGDIALCASGGGITGIYFELGALKCLDDCLPPGAIHGFDSYYGISAGAVVCSVLAAGYSVDEFMAAIAGHPGGRIEELDLSLMRLAHLNAGELPKRLADFAGNAARNAVRRMKPGRQGPDQEGIDASSLLPAPFQSGAFEQMLRGILERAGANAFGALPRPLFIGASDQDTRSAVLFGSEHYDHVPISKAVQASMSINPAFSAVPIEGRWYEDGAVTRTSDYQEAIRRGSTLVFVLDPFVPYVSPEPGDAHRRGVLYNVDQDIRALSFTRYVTGRDHTLRRHPEVSTYTFVPANRQRVLLSRNPMDHRPWREIWRAAYLSTLQRLQRLRHRLAGDVRAHGLDLNLDRAEAVAERIQGKERPELVDFFPDGRVELRLPRLVNE